LRLGIFKLAVLNLSGNNLVVSIFPDYMHRKSIVSNEGILVLVKAIENLQDKKVVGNCFKILALLAAGV
jgi:hypothetical protein